MNSSSLLNATRIAAQLAVGEQPKCPPGYCAHLATCGDHLCPGLPREGLDVAPSVKPISRRAEFVLYAVLALISTGAALLWIYLNH